MDNRYSQVIGTGDNGNVQAEPFSTGGGGWVSISDATFYTDSMAHLADVLEAASKAVRAVAADQHYEKGEAS